MFENNFTRWHAIVALALWLAFAALTLVIVLRGLDHAAQRPLTVAATVAGSALGPMSGAIGRGLQSCCRQDFLCGSGEVSCLSVMPSADSQTPNQAMVQNRDSVQRS